MAAREVLAELSAQYQAATGQAVQCEPAGGKDVARRVRAGEGVDLVVLAGDVIGQLLAEGHVVAGSRRDLARSGIGVAVRQGAPGADISTEEAVREAVLAARSLSYSTGPSGDYLEQEVFKKRWQILEQIRSRIFVPPPGTPVATLVADGRAELGFQQLSELLNQPGIQLLGSLPATLQITTVFAGGIAATSQRPDAAGAWLAYMAAPAAATVKQRHGMESA
jgi:molybdate transport system substrate-binding protein